MNNQRIHSSSRVLVLGLVAIILFLGIGLSSLAFAAATDNFIEVNSPGDDKKSNDGFCTLREAIIAANSNKTSGGVDGECEAGSTGTDVILLPTGVYMLERTDNGGENSSQTGDLDIQEDLIVRRNGPGLVVISGDSITDRVIHIQPGIELTLEGVTVRDGNANDVGGGIFNDGGILNLINSTLTANNAATSGAALYNQNNDSDVAVSYLTNVTITGNDTSTGAASGLGNGSGTIEVKNSIISNDSCSTGVTFVGENLAYNAPGCAPTTLTSDPLFDPVTVPIVPPLPDQNLLLPGSEVLFELQSTSPAVNQIEAVDCPASLEDQLGLPRPQGGLCEIGAVELEYTYLVVTNNSDDVAVEGSLPWAIQQANTIPGTDTIVFAIGGVCSDATIYLNSPLPPITEPVIIDGTLNEDDSRCNDLHITIDGQGNSFDGITILSTAEGSTIRNLIIQNFGLSGIVMLGDVEEPTGDGIGNTITGNVIQNNGGSGIVIGEFNVPSNGNLVEENTISGNGFQSDIFNDGITVPAGVNNQFTNNDIYDNADQSVDLGADGRTENDPGDPDPGANWFQNYPELYAVSLEGYAGGRLDSLPGMYTVQFFSGLSCAPDEPLTLIHEMPVEVTTDGGGKPIVAEFSELISSAGFDQGTGIWTTATDANGNTSELSDCVAAEENNVVWTQSKTILPGNSAIRGFLSTPGEARWFSFDVKPGMDITIDLFDLPANYDLTVYKDIGQTYAELQNANGTEEFDLERAGAESPLEMIPSTSFSPGAYSPGAYSPGAYSPGAYSPGAYSPGAYSPLGFAPGAYSEDVIAPGAYSPGAYSPGAYSPGAYSPGAYSPNEFLSGVDPALYASAQLSSLIAVSAFNNTASESVTVNSFTNSGKYYIRVRGRNGVAIAESPFWLQVTQSATDCSTVNPDVTGSGPYAYYGNMTDPQTVIVVDWTRLQTQFPASGDPDTPEDELNDLNLGLKSLADAYNGVIVDVGQPGSLIFARNSEAERDDNEKCPYAKNLVADEIKQVIDSYRFKPDDSSNTNLEYVVIVGGDDVVPFFRIPDGALLGPESTYQPPVSIFSSSEASLRNNFVLTDDFYGAKVGVSYKDSSIPAIDLAVGRMVEYPADMLAQLTAFETAVDGVANRTKDANGSPYETEIQTFVTGYDFLVDAVVDIMDELKFGTGVTPDTLVTPDDVEPAPGLPFEEIGLVDSGGPWTGSHVIERLTNNDKDLIFLAGHFSASSLLAADFDTGITTQDLLGLGGEWNNVIVYGAGCHVGYNIVDHHSTPFTQNPDWASALASLGSTLIGGTGYQYGDTQHLEYSERLYLYFTEELHTGYDDSVSIGQALVRAKQRYLANTPYMRGIHQKALIEATIFGLPMLAVDMPNRESLPDDESEVTSLTAELENPGLALGLKTAPISFVENDLNYTLGVVDLENVEDGTPETISASWYYGDHGVVTNPGEPALPLFGKNVSSPEMNYSLRGVGFRSATYDDYNKIPESGIDIYPVVGAAATEIRAVNLSFLSSFWFPIRMWSANFYDSLLADGSTDLYVTPVQYITDEAKLLDGETPPQSLMRRYSTMDFQLYYSAYTSNAGTNQPAQASPPDIAQVTSMPDETGTSVEVKAMVVGNPGAGIQDVWVTFTGIDGLLYGSWSSADLVQDEDDTRFWHGSFDITGTDVEKVRFIVQACGGNGRCSLVDNLGNYFRPGIAAESVLTEIADSPLSNVPDDEQKVGEQVTFTARLTEVDSTTGVAGKPVFFGLGPESRVGITDPSGYASATFLLVSTPGTYDVTAWFPGDPNYTASTSPALPFDIVQQSTALTLSGPDAPILLEGSLPVSALLTDQSANELPLVEQAVLFAVFDDSILECPANDVEAETAGAVAYKTAYTNPSGKAALGEVAVDAGDYLVCAYFRENPSYGGSSAQFSLTINAAPVATADSYSINLGDVLALDAPGVLGNDTDADGDNLTAELLSGPTSPAFLVPLAADGSFTYQLQGPIPASFKSSFTYRACDPYGACSEETTVTIQFNQPPKCDEVIVETADGYPSLWPVNKDKTDLLLKGAYDVDSLPPLQVLFEKIWMDEEPGKRTDASISQSCEDAWVLSDRDSQGDGRVYQIDYFVRDSDNAYCRGSVDIATLPHDQSGDAQAIKGPDLVEVASCSLQLPPKSSP